MTGSFAADPWLACLGPRPQASLRLFCLPHAGGGASQFRIWSELMPAWVEVCPVQLPGRETRFREPPFTRLAPLVQGLARALRPYLNRPFALFGHSMGGLLSFELARQLRRDHNLEPTHLFVSGCSAPQVRREEPPRHVLPGPAFREELRRLGGMAREILENEELMDLLLPTLRADFAVCETYEYGGGPPLGCPISALGGLQDETVNWHQLNAWRDQTTGSFQLRLLAGDHFFLRAAQPHVVKVLCQQLRRPEGSAAAVTR